MKREIDTSCAVQKPVSDALEAILGHAFPVLDHGFIRVVDYMGVDESISEAARTSYGKGTTATSSPQGLINRLMRLAHTSPFEMCEIKFHIKMPIFVMRQWIRHRTANVNEYSARYSILNDEFYIPLPEHLAKQSKTDKQGREQVFDHQEACEILEILKLNAASSYEDYRILSEPENKGGDYGLSRELARMAIPVNVYTECYWKIDLHNLLHFLRLRADSHAQYEIRAYADIMMDLVKQWVPMTHSAFMKYRMNAVTFSEPELKIISNMLPELFDAKWLPDFSKSEVLEFNKKLAILKEHQNVETR